MYALQALSRIGLVLLAGVLLGALFERPIVGLVLALAAVLLFWLLQLERLQRWLADSSQPPPNVHGVFGDTVSRIYRNQRQSDADQRRLQSLVDYLLQSFSSLRDGVIIVEQGGGIRWSNEAATQLLGVRHPQDMGRAITNLVRYPEFVDYFQNNDYDDPLQFQTGGQYPRVLQLTVTHFSEGDRLLFIRDVSAQVRIEQMRRDFVANVSHELRTPLTVISGYLGNFLLAGERLPQGFVKPLEQMSQQADRMEHLLRDLLWLSRIESEEGVRKRERVDVALLLEELRAELSSTFPQRSLELQLETRQKVRGDYRELHSAVSNLILNAFKYSGEQDPVTVTWKQQGSSLRLSVVDRGIGIDPVHLPRLTERFYRVDDSRNSSTGGTGLGLAIVKHVAVAHQARLDIRSSPGRGSEFSLEFPLPEETMTYTRPGDRAASGG